jgi:hypothetical protein
MNEPPTSARRPLLSGMLLTSEEHAKLAETYANPDPDWSEGLAQKSLELSRHHAVLSKCALRREQAWETVQAFFASRLPRDKGGPLNH